MEKSTNVKISELKKIVALKKIKILKPTDGFPLSTVREIRILNLFHNDNIIQLRQVITIKHPDGNDVVFLVFDYYEYDLFALLNPSIPYKLSNKQKVSYCLQLVLAMIECKKQNVLHRDLKPANLFITHNNILKVGDFGLARLYRDDVSKYSTNVITLFYRPPELFFNDSKYKFEIDVWSVGCIIYEIITQHVLFKSKETHDDINQLRAIFEITGTPTSDWAEFKTLDKGHLFIREIPSKFAEHLKTNIPQEFECARDLIMKMCELNPKKRISIEEAYEHPFIQMFREEAEPSHLPLIKIEEFHQMKVREILKKN